MSSRALRRSIALSPHGVLGQPNAMQRERSVAGCPLFGEYQPATKGEFVSAAKATLDKWL